MVVLRSSAPAAAAEQGRRAIHALDPEMAVFDPAPVEASILAQDLPQRILALLVGSLGLCALAIAALGVYGVMADTVSRRLREFGIRLALGAARWNILRAVIDDATHECGRLPFLRSPRADRSACGGTTRFQVGTAFA